MTGVLAQIRTHGLAISSISEGQKGISFKPSIHTLKEVGADPG
jgi:hypothetical protein